MSVDRAEVPDPPAPGHGQERPAAGEAGTESASPGMSLLSWRPASSGTLATGVLSGGFLVVVLVTAVLVATGVVSDSRTVAARRLAAAAERLAGAHAVELRGTVVSGPDRLNGDLKITRRGWSTGTVTWSGQRVELISVSGGMYVKGDVGFWRDQDDVGSDSPWISRDRWGRLGAATVGLVLQRRLTPEAIAQGLREIGRYTIQSTKRTSVRGVPALMIRTSTGTYDVSVDGTPRLLRIETTYPEVAADVTEFDADALATGPDPVRAELRARIGQLKDSFDPAQRTRVDHIDWGSCTVSACTVRTEVWSTRGERPSIPLTVFVRLTAGDKNGRTLGSCTARGTVTSAGPTVVGCRVTGPAWSNFRRGFGYLRWWGHAEAMAGGATASDVQAMVNRLESE